ncbi:MAG: SufS family cysteine desulfurase [Silvibacterium sp.]|nr:SufS family cysteine desulfurase [Silvibacterium sp.]
MTTSDPGRLILPAETPTEAAPATAPEFLPAGLPDPATIARMANEFFTALPGAEGISLRSVPTQAPTALETPPATIPAAPSEASLPSHPYFVDPHFPGAPASGGGATLSPVTAPAQVNPPAVPGASSTDAAGLSGDIPAFSFLQDARPIFSDRNTVPTGPYAPAKPLAEFVPERAILEGLPSFETERFPQFAEAAQPPSPTIPSSLGFLDFSPVPAFSFLEEARPLLSYPPTIPGPAPAIPGFEPHTPTRPADTGTANPDSLSSFEFLRDLRTLSSDGSEPHLESAAIEPAGIEPNVPRDLNLSSYSFDAEALKRDFPILRQKVNGRPLVWLDNAATTQKPQSVIDRLKYFYEHENSNVHRAAHELAARATDAYESAREKVRRFLNASSTREIIFVRGTTEGINLVAQSWGRRNIQKDDEIVITWLEHHANIVPWQMLASEKGAKLRVAPVDNSGQVLLDEYEKLLGPKTRLVAMPQVSNALGVIPPVADMIEAAHRHGAKVLLDGAQSVSHMQVDVQSLDCDFFVFSGHKVFAPTGIGVVYGKQEVLEHMPPWQGGGNMIQDVTFEKTLYQVPPQRFEAGTGNIADAVGLGAAIDYLDRVGMSNISRHEHGLLTYATESLQRIPGLHIIGTAREKAGVLSFIIDGFRNEEIGDYLNRYGVAVRSGHHCAQPILRRFGLESTVRASLALYNTYEDIDTLVMALWNLTLRQNSIA